MTQEKTIELFSIDRNRELIFIETMKELNYRVKSKDKSPYNIIRKSALLRLLVIDGSKFYTVINKKYNLKIDLNLTFNFHQGHSLSTFDDPNSGFVTHKYFDDENGEKCTIPKFLKLPAIKTNNPQLKNYLNHENRIAEEYSNAELIQLIANAHGGVHIANWDIVSDFIASDSSSPFNINQNSKMHDLIDNIAEIIFTMLEPLSKMVFENIQKTPPVAYETESVVINGDQKLKITSRITAQLKKDSSLNDEK
ncbi:MAG: hypothetical protein ABI207_01770 [Crocinitomicaceae bacterium]